MNADVHDKVRERIAYDDADATVNEHLAQCADCQRWANRLDGIRSAAVHLGTKHPTSAQQVDQIALAVHGATRGRQRRRVAGWVSVAAVTVAAVGVATLASRDSAPDRLAAVADVYAVDGTRFVFEASATVALPEMGAVGDLQPVVLRSFPVCATEPTPSSEFPTGADLGDMVDELLSAEPCVALSGLRDELGPRAQAAADSLNLQATSAARRIEQLEATTSDGDALVRQSAQSAIVEARASLGTAQEDLLELRDAQNESVNQLAEVAQSANSGAQGGFQPAARDSVFALAAVLDNTSSTDVTRNAVEWNTLGTGTWTRSTVELSGTATSDAGSATVFDSVDNDPLALAQVLFADPDTLLAVLRGAPTSSGASVRWTVPTDVASIQGANPFEAEATFTSTGFDRLQLSTRRADGTVITITFIPAR